MKIITSKLLFLLLFIGLYSKAQSVRDFEQDFEQITLANYPNNKVDSLFKKYNHVLFFFNSNSQLAATISEKESSIFPLESFRETDLYQRNIDLLLTDTSYHKNSLGYFIAASTNDQSKIPQITSILQKSNYKDFWAANILMVLQTKDVTPLVKTILNYKDHRSVSYLLTPFLQLDVAVLESFALDSIKSKDLYIQFLAIRAMAKGELKPHKDALLRGVVSNGEEGLKGWGISALANFGAGDMLPLVQEYLNNKDLREVSLRALANSPSTNDELFLDDLLRRDTVEAKLLGVMLESNRGKNIQKWFEVVRGQILPVDYYPSINRSSIMNNDRYFDEVCETLKKSKNQKQIYPLYDYFSNRKDERSLMFLLNCWLRSDQDRMVKYGILKNLKGKESDLIRSNLPSLMKNATIEDVELVELLIEYKNTDYHDLVSSWLQTGELESYYRPICENYLKL